MALSLYFILYFCVCHIMWLIMLPANIEFITNSPYLSKDLDDASKKLIHAYIWPVVIASIAVATFLVFYFLIIEKIVLLYNTLKEANEEIINIAITGSISGSDVDDAGTK